MPEDELPTHLRGALEIEIQKAEIAYIGAQRKAGDKRDERWNESFTDYVRRVVLCYASQACKAGDEGIWTVQQIRLAVNAFATQTITEQYREKWPGDVFPAKVSALFEKSLRAHPQWSLFQSNLLSVATKQEELQSRPKPKPVVIHEPGLGQRMERAAIDLDVSHEELARRIGIGRTTYFSVKAGRGRIGSRMRVERYLLKHLPSVG